jgi:hypothetical protein
MNNHNNNIFLLNDFFASDGNSNEQKPDIDMARNTHHNFKVILNSYIFKLIFRNDILLMLGLPTTIITKKLS